MLDGAGAGGFVSGPAGPPAWGAVAAWAPATAYAATPPAAVVTYGGSCYVCSVSHTSGSTFDTSKWTQIAQQGGQGPIGVGQTGPAGPAPWQTPPAPWALSTGYTATAPASVVSYSGGCYVCATTHTSGSTFDASKWVLVASPVPTSGAPVQRVAASTAAVSTTSVQTPITDAAPTTTNTSMVSGLSVTLTPKAAANKLRVRAVLQGSLSALGAIVAALFQNGAANAVAANLATCGGQGYITQVVLSCEIVAGSTSPITFALGAGCNNNATFTINGNGGARIFGGVMLSAIEVEEYAA